MEEMTIYLNYLALVEHEYFHYASVFPFEKFFGKVIFHYELK